MEKKSEFTIGLIGNPNVGKTSLFNLLTGSHQHIGNWPGKTVEKKEGEFSFVGRNIKLVDLPGAYSLNAYTEEEAVTSDFIFDEKPEVILQIIDAQNLERNLLMTVHLIEIGAPLVVALNRIDAAEDKGIHIDIPELSDLLGIPVVGINVREKKGIGELLDAIFNRDKYINKNGRKISYGKEFEEELIKLKKIVSRDKELDRRRLDWMCFSFLQGDKDMQNIFLNKPYLSELISLRKLSTSRLTDIFGEDLSTILTRIRYGFIQGLAREVITREKVETNSFSDNLDKIALSRFWGIPFFFAVLLIVFQISFKVSEPISALIEELFNVLGSGSVELLNTLGFSQWTTSLVVDGVIGGVGSVLVFVPILGTLFLFIAILEDSGYMARIAYIMDRFMHKLGLHGKAFIPMILGFGCNVPGIMATRALETKRDRLLAITLNPFMSCGARLPVYVLFAGVFFPDRQGLIILSLYILGVLVAVLVGLIFRRFLFQELSSPFVIELPSYQIPNWKGVSIHAWERTWIFIKKAGTLILAFSIFIWFLANLPAGVVYGSEDSLAGALGKLVSPLLAPLGFNSWQAAVALIFGIAGKEIIVGTFGTLYGGGSADTMALSSALSQDFTPLSAYAFMVFVLLYTPCAATLAVIKKETGSWKWTIFVAFYTVLIAWLAAFAVYNGGKLLGF